MRDNLSTSCLPCHMPSLNSAFLLISFGLIVLFEHIFADDHTVCFEVVRIADFLWTIMYGFLCWIYRVQLVEKASVSAEPVQTHGSCRYWRTHLRCWSFITIRHRYFSIYIRMVCYRRTGVWEQRWFSGLGSTRLLRVASFVFRQALMFRDLAFNDSIHNERVIFKFCRSGSCSMMKVDVILLKCHIELGVILLLNGRIINRTFGSYIDVLFLVVILFNIEHYFLLLLTAKLLLADWLRTNRCHSCINVILKIICLGSTGSNPFRF